MYLNLTETVQKVFFCKKIIEIAFEFFNSVNRLLADLRAALGGEAEFYYQTIAITR